MSDEISKTKLAELLEISQSRVTQLVKHGLPVKPNGKVDLRDALKWLKQFLRPGPLLDRASQLLAKLEASQQIIGLPVAEPPKAALPPHFKFVEKIDDPADRGAVLASMQMAYWAPENAATLALATGSTVGQAWAIYKLVTHAATIKVGEILRSMGCEPFSSHDDPPVWWPEGRAAIDWKATAKERGEAYDTIAWDAVVAKAGE